MKKNLAKMNNDFKTFNKVRSVNHALLIFLVIFFVIFANIFSAKYYQRTFFNEHSRYKLSDATVQKLSQIKKNVQIYVLLEHSESEAISEIKNDISKLLNEYIESNNLITVNFLDLNHESEDLRVLSRKTGILPSNVIVIQIDDQIQVLSLEEFYEVHNGEVVGFCGERVLTAGIESLLTGDKKNIYFTVGHGEYDINDVSPSFGLSTLATILRQKSYNVKNLDLSVSKNIPEDADLVIISGAKVPFLNSEVLSLKNYLDKNGGSLIITISDTKDRLLNEFILDHGICVNQDAYILPSRKDTSFNDDLLVKKFVHHEITDPLIDLKLPIVFGCTYEVHEAEWVSDDDFQVTDIAQADGTVDPENVDESSFIVASLFEKSNLNEIDILNGKILVIGCSDFLTNSRINVLGNKIFFSKAVDFMCGVKPDLSISSTMLKKYRLDLDFKQYTAIVCSCLLLCSVWVILGITVYFLRRK